MGMARWSIGCFPLTPQTVVRYSVALCSDDEQFGGHCRVQASTLFFTSPDSYDGRRNSLKVSKALYHNIPLAEKCVFHQVF